MHKEQKKGFNLIRFSITMLLLYNFVYLTARYFPNFLTGILQPLYESVLDHAFLFTILEALGVISLFVDLVGGWDRRSGSTRKRQLFVVVLLVLLFLFKFSIRVIEAMLPEFH